jgi:hypothetical protein
MHELTKEKYLSFKQQGKSDTDIMKEYPMSSSTLFRKKKAWGLSEKNASSSQPRVPIPPQQGSTVENVELRRQLEHLTSVYTELGKRHERLEKENTLLKSLLNLYL